MELQFLDSSRWVPNHPGVTIIPSTGGLKVRALLGGVHPSLATAPPNPARSLADARSTRLPPILPRPPDPPTPSLPPQLYSVGLGDDTSQWTAVDMWGWVWKVEAIDWFQEYSMRYSDPADPLPLNGAPNAPYTNALLTEHLDDVCVETFITGGRTKGRMQGVGARCARAERTCSCRCPPLPPLPVERFWRFHLINSVLPVTLVAFLGLMIFALDHRDMGLRLEIIVTLFLSLTAVQFVLADRTPTSSYVVPTQQLVLTTYIFLMLICIESIIVFHISHWRERKEIMRVR